MSSIHKLGYAHLDLSMENFVLDARGHVYVCDFDSCLPVSDDGLVIVDESVPPEQPDKNIEYIAPEHMQVGGKSTETATATLPTTATIVTPPHVTTTLVESPALPRPIWYRNT